MRMLYHSRLKNGTVRFGVEVRVGRARVLRREGFDSKEEAEAWAAEAVKTWDKPKGSKMTFAAHAAEAVAALDLRDGSRKGYQNTVALWLDPVLGDKPLASITRHHVETALDACRGAGKSEKTVRNTLVVAKSIFRKAVEWDRIPVSPADGITVSVPRQHVDCLSPTQAKRLESHLAGLDSVEALALRLILGTGLRISEALALHAEDWNADERRLRVRSSKTAKGVRFVDVPDRLAPVLGQLVAESGGGALLRRTADHKLRAVLEAESAAAGVPYVKVHGLRHTRATALQLAGVPTLYVAEQLGHASPAITAAIYGHSEVAGPTERRKWKNV